MRCVVATLIAVALSASASAAPARQFPVRQLEVAPKEVILGWINQYRHHPEPDKVPLAVHGMSRLGLLTDTEGAGVYVGFLAGIIASNPDRADELIAKIFPLSTDHQWAVVRAIAYSGRPDWRTVLQRHAGHMPLRRVMKGLSTWKSSSAGLPDSTTVRRLFRVFGGPSCQWPLR